MTPNYNQAEFIEETIRSILLQGYPNLEYIIIDGGSEDNTLEIIKRYEPWITYWVSESDRGQSHGINKGFQRCTGDYIAWMNSSDCYMLGALHSLFGKATLKNIDFVFSNSTYSGYSLKTCAICHSKKIETLNLNDLLHFFCSVDYIIPSQSVFISRQFLGEVGDLNENLHYCMDLEWFVRIALQQPKTYKIEQPISFYRYHSNAKTTLKGQQVLEEARAIARKYSVYLSECERDKLTRLLNYQKEYSEYLFKIKTKSLVNLIGTLKRWPREAISDRRFLGMLKSTVFSLSVKD